MNTKVEIRAESQIFVVHACLAHRNLKMLLFCLWATGPYCPKYHNWKEWSSLNDSCVGGHFKIKRSVGVNVVNECCTASQEATGNWVI